MKLISVAVLALISQSGAVKLSDDVDDLWSDNGEADETLKSLQQAEKAHGTKFEGLSQAEQGELIKSKNMMKFSNDDEFVKNTKRTFTEADKALVMTEEHINYPMPQPIGLLMTKSKDLASGGLELGLSGTMDDAEEYEETMESLKSAEFTMGKQMKKPEVSTSLYEKSGSKIENILADSHRISVAEIEEGMKSKEEEIAHRQAKKQVEVTQVAAQQKKEEVKVKQAFNQMAAHFNDDDVYDESWE